MDKKQLSKTSWLYWRELFFSFFMFFYVFFASFSPSYSGKKDDSYGDSKSNQANAKPRKMNMCFGGS